MKLHLQKFIFLLMLFQVQSFALDKLNKKGALLLDFVFKVETNLPLSVEGKLEEKVKLDINIISINEVSFIPFSINIKDIKTGFELRDQHMRELVFSNKNIEISPLGTCKIKDNKCSQKISLKISSQEVEKEIILIINKDEKSFHSEFNVLLSDFKISRPSKMGAKVDDSVSIKINGQFVN